MKVIVESGNEKLEYTCDTHKYAIAEYINTTENFSKAHLQEAIIALESALNVARMKYQATFNYA